MARPITPEEKANMADRYTRGQSIKFISFALSRDPLTVKKALKEHGIRVESRRARNANWGWTG